MYARAFLLNVLSSGEYGMGTMANELTLGCDCLGTIHYLVSPSRLCPRQGAYHAPRMERTRRMTAPQWL